MDPKLDSQYYAMRNLIYFAPKKKQFLLHKNNQKVNINLKNK